MDLDVVTINSEDPNQDLVKLVEEGVEFFPPYIWDSINYTGEVEFPCDRELFMGERFIPSFEYRKLISRLRKIKRKKPLLGIISNHLVYFESIFYENGKLKISYMPIRDYMEEVGFVSLLKLENQVASKIIAHALGHNRGLEHHHIPIDLMYPELRDITYVPEQFCKKCIYTLDRSEGILNMLKHKLEHYLKSLKPL
jgi:predicted Zn-dependent protease